LAETVNEKKKN